MVLWKPSLLMSVYNVHLTSVRVKDKACIYNDLRTRTRIGCIAGIGLHRRWPGRAKTDCRVSKSDMGIFQQLRSGLACAVWLLALTAHQVLGSGDCWVHGHLIARPPPSSVPVILSTFVGSGFFLSGAGLIG
jgi:hypothetical protein